jgi:hypothetical protein
MRDLHAIFAALAVAALVGCGGGGGGEPHDGPLTLDIYPKRDAAPVGLAGRLTLNHVALPDGVKGWVSVYAQAPGVGSPPVDSTEVAADGAWSFPDLAAGSYYLLGAVDVNRSGGFDAPGSTLTDPFVVLGPQSSPAAGVAIDVLTVRAMVGSARVAGTGGDETRLTVLWASVLDPRNAAALTDAAVVVGDGTNQLPLAFSSTEVAYVPATALSAAAVDGTYTFTVSHPLAYQTPLAVAVAHQPLLARPTVLAPTADQHFGAVQDVQVSWQQAAGASDSMVEVYEGTTRVYRAEAVLAPFLIPAASAGFTAGHTYRVTVTDARYGGDTNLISVEAGASDVTISF